MCLFKKTYYSNKDMKRYTVSLIHNPINFYWSDCECGHTKENISMSNATVHKTPHLVFLCASACRSTRTHFPSKALFLIFCTHLNFFTIKEHLYFLNQRPCRIQKMQFFFIHDICETVKPIFSGKIH